MSLGDALLTWLDGDHEPDRRYVDAVNFNSSFAFTGELLGTAVGVVPPDLMRRMYEADATAPALLRTAEFVARLFEAEIRPMALRREMALDASQRRAVELYRAEFAHLRDLQRRYVQQLDVILHELVEAGF